MQSTIRAASAAARMHSLRSLVALRPVASSSRLVPVASASYQNARNLHQSSLLLKPKKRKAAKPEPPAATPVSPMPAETAPVSTSTPEKATAENGIVAATKDNVTNPEEAPTKTLTERAKEMWSTVKYLFKFYFNGLKQIWANRAVVKGIKDRVAGGGTALNREEYQLLRTHRSDMRKLPLFVSILLILEEALPLVVIWAPSLLPSTCVLPSQLIKIRMGAEVKRAEACEKLRQSETVQSLLPVLDTKAARLRTDKDTTQLMTSLSNEELASLAKMYSLPTWGGASMTRRRLDTHLAYIQEDDSMLFKETPTIPKGLDALAKACSERGLRCTDIEESEMSETLGKWIKTTASSQASPSTLALLSVQMYKAASLENVKSSIEAEKQRGLIAQTKDVLREVVEEEKKVLSKQGAKQATQ